MRKGVLPKSLDQRGLNTFITIAIIIGVGIVFLMLFFISLSGSKRPTTSTEGNNQTDGQNAQTETKSANSNEAPFIRIPDNSLIYSDTKYKFMFAYPDSFGKLSETAPVEGSVSLKRIESALAVNKPVGIGTAFLNGPLGVYVFGKDNFKLAVGSNSGVEVGPTKTGNDITWKVVSRATNSTMDVSVGKAYPVRSSKSQTGVTVFDFAQNDGKQLLGRWVFASGDFFVMVALPYVSKPSKEPLTEQDLAAYNIIGANIAKTIRTPNDAALPNSGN